MRSNFCRTPVNRNYTEQAVTYGSFVWNELHTRDVEAPKVFYAATVGPDVQGYADAVRGTAATGWLGL
jgi:predicted enzyme related to lactoylglutathione lyase